MISFMLIVILYSIEILTTIVIKQKQQQLYNNNSNNSNNNYTIIITIIITRFPLFGVPSDQAVQQLQQQQTRKMILICF